MGCGLYMEKHYDLNTDQNAKREIMGGLELRKILLNRVSKFCLFFIFQKKFHTKKKKQNYFSIHVDLLS